MNTKLLATPVLLLLIPCLLSAEQPADKGGNLTEVVIEDDWPGAPPLSEGTMNCPGGEIEFINPVTPFCATTGRIHFREMAWWACYTSDDPRLSGVGMATASGNLDADYTGPVWGTWTIVPSPDCDPLDLIDPPVFWEGTWQGQRSQYCADDQCVWIGDLKLVGKGYGGNIDGIHLKGTELITTYTPLPVPWEFIPGFPLTGPEGIITATIKE
jgi:hypothetical protein